MQSVLCNNYKTNCLCKEVFCKHFGRDGSAVCSGEMESCTEKSVIKRPLCNDLMLKRLEQTQTGLKIARERESLMERPVDRSIATTMRGGWTD